MNLGSTAQPSLPESWAEPGARTQHSLYPAGWVCGSQATRALAGTWSEGRAWGDLGRGG